MISKLESIGIQEHGVTEEYINSAGAELLRSLLQGHLDKLAHDENRFASVSNADDLPRNHVRQGTTPDSGQPVRTSHSHSIGL